MLDNIPRHSKEENKNKNEINFLNNINSNKNRKINFCNYNSNCISNNIKKSYTRINYIMPPNKFVDDKNNSN